MAAAGHEGPIERIVIVGGGPSGATLGARLARAGREVVLFARGKRPPIIVGESLVPAIVPYLRELGIEDEVAGYSIRKEGATFVFDRESRLDIRFDEVRRARTTYSYNTPRDRFDASVLEAARRAGVRVVEEACTLEREGDSDRIRLADASLEASGLSAQPDFIVDAGGRSRNVIRLLDIPYIDGDRRDVALHAHFEGIEVEIEGNVHTDRLGQGWSWRIPLPGRVSLGLVVDAQTARKFGDTAEEQLDNFLAQDPVIGDYARPARRVTPVVRYSNYQSRSTRMTGANWALVGDAGGFVDPVFSSGVAIAFQSADYLSQALLDGRAKALAAYERKLTRLFGIWHTVIGLFYNGRLLTLFRVGQVVRETFPGRLVDWHFRRHMPKIFTGEDVGNFYSYRLVRFMSQYALAGNDPEELRIL